MKWIKFVLLGTALISSQAMSERWVLTYTKDEMRGTTEKVLQTISVKPVELLPNSPKRSFLSLVLRSPQVELKEGQDPEDIVLDKAILVISSGQFNCSSYNGCHINVKFDNEKIQKYQTRTPKNGSTDVMYLVEPNIFLKDVKKHKQLIIEADFYQAGPRQFKFTLDGYHSPETEL